MVEAIVFADELTQRDDIRFFEAIDAREIRLTGGEKFRKLHIRQYRKNLRENNEKSFLPFLHFFI